MTTYRIIRFFADDNKDREVVDTGLTRDEAKEHCSGPAATSRRATSAEAQERTAKYGAWFDGMEPE